MSFDTAKFDNSLQIGGIRTGTLDYPNPGGGQSCRVAHFNTGGGLRFTVAIDRGGDIVEAAFNDTNLAYLAPSDYKPPNPAYHRDLEWLVGWPGGLVTTAGPVDIGEPRMEDGRAISLHGRHSNTPASIVAVENPDPARGEWNMRLKIQSLDSRMFGPCMLLRREISCRLGENAIVIRDEITNRGDEPTPHAWLYHVNFGYPLLDEGTRLLYQGSGTLYRFLDDSDPLTQPSDIKVVPLPLDGFRGAREQVVLVDSTGDEQGHGCVGIVNERRGVGVELAYSANALPRLANWLHFGPRGSYVTALEPFFGSLFGRAKDDHPSATATLKPGESRSYELRVTVRSTLNELSKLIQCDGPLELREGTA